MIGTEPAPEHDLRLRQASGDSRGHQTGRGMHNSGHSAALANHWRPGGAVILWDFCSVFFKLTHSYGALCKKRSGTSMSKVFVCYDHMVGHSNIVFIHNKYVNKCKLLIFAYPSCLGG